MNNSYFYYARIIANPLSGDKGFTINCPLYEAFIFKKLYTETIGGNGKW